MSYLSYPRIHFSGTYQASPSTINNTPNNWNPLIYPSPNELGKVELYWNPRGNGGFALMDDCVVKQVDYANGTSATTPEEDSIIGQPVKCIYKSSFPLQSTLVDLDPMQQNTSEIWAMTLQIGGDANLTGNVPNVAFTGIWGQCQGPNAPHSSASGSAVFQAQMNNVELTGDTSSSRFLDHYQQNPTGYLSLNVNTNAHNNSPQSYAFNSDTFDAMNSAGVPQAVLEKMEPLQHFFQNSTKDDTTGKYVPANPGDIPTEEFVKYMLQQFLTTDEYNTNIDIILQKTILPYNGYGPYDFLFGMITGTVGPSSTDEATYFVPTREMVPKAINPNTNSPYAFYTPFTLDDSGTIVLNLGNSLPTENPGNDIYHDEIGQLSLVAFPNGIIEMDNAVRLLDLDISGEEFIANTAGFYTAQLQDDYSSAPLGIISQETNSILLAEDSEGYYMRADQFVYRMNPGYDTTSDYPRGKTNIINIHVLKFGNPVTEPTNISMRMKTEAEAIKYTLGTAGTSGTKGVKNLSVPQTGVLDFPAQATTDANGIATFDISCEDPNNPRHYVDGQVYFLDYNFADIPKIQKDKNDIISVMVYDQNVEADAPDVLAKFGRLYKIMGFLADEQSIEQIDMRNMIKTLLEKPMGDLVHMPVTRDLSKAARDKVVAWVDALNNS